MGDIDGDRLREGAEYASRWVGYQAALRQIPGAVVGVGWKDNTVVLQGHGLADVEKNNAMRPDHIFRIASHSKTFTAVAVMKLVEEGKLRLDDSLGAHVPWLSGRAGRATVRQALNHAAGVIRDGRDSDYWHLDRPFPDEAGLQALVEDGGDVLPANERFKYSNIAYSLLGLVIEAVSGSSYHQYVRAHIVDPLGLQDTGPETDEHARERLVTGYSPQLPGMARCILPDVPTGAMAAATGFYSTASDLLRYASAHFMGNEELLTDWSKREMQAPYWGAGDGTYYGLGLAVTTVGERRLVGHSGGFPGHSTRTWLDPHDRIAATVLFNQSNAATKALADGVIKLIDFALSRNQPSTTPAGDLDRFTGQFWTSWGVTDIVRFGDTLFLLDPSADDPTASPVTLQPMGYDVFRIESENGYGSPCETVTYERDGDGSITRVRIGGGSGYPEPIFRQRLDARARR